MTGIDQKVAKVSETMWQNLFEDGYVLHGGDDDEYGPDGELLIDGDASPPEERDEADESDSEDDSDEEDDAEDTAKAIKRLERKNRKLERDLEAATDLLNSAAERESEEEDEEVRSELETVTAERDTLLEVIRTDFVEHAVNNFEWKWESTEAVYKFLDIDELEIDLSTREIHGLEDQLEEIAEKYPFLLAKGSKRSGAPAGSAPGKPAGKTKDGKKSEEFYANEFPAMLG